ncbi:thiamine diphosphokinase [Listeria aquatica]|uniref:thiamine diphosphokinase n=1 Tax=Listeria aquatica TaxID=1494960 RepID=UPI0031F4A5E0
MKAIHIMVGGPVELVPPLDSYLADAEWIGIDGGAKRLLEFDIPMKKALGDFDSLSAEELTQLKQRVRDVTEFPAEKDLTDTEIGLMAAMEEKPDVIRIFGATGGRMDHLLANLMMLTKPEFRQAVPLVEIIDCYNWIKMYLPGHYEIQKLQEMRYAAFITMENVTGLTLTGFKYPLQNATFSFARALSSNEFLQDSGTFSFDSGLILMIQSKD